jgi:hypothetical protein
VQIAKIKVVAALAFPAVSASLVTAGPAMADCTSMADMTVCGEAGMAAEAVTPMPVYPYPCDLDWYCDGGGMSLMFDSTLEVGQPGSGGLNADRGGGPDQGGLYTDPYR